MVVKVARLKVSSTYLLIRDVFPEVASPMRTILKMKSNLQRERVREAHLRFEIILGTLS